MEAIGRPARVVLADDESMFRSCLRKVLTVSPAVIRHTYQVDVGYGFDVVGEAGSGEDTVTVVQSVKPDLLLVDLSMPRMTGLQALRELAPLRGHMRTILLAGSIRREDLLTAVELGVHGVLLKDTTTEVLFEAVVSVLAGECWVGRILVNDLMDAMRTLMQSSGGAARRQAIGLTPRERDVVTMVVAGCANGEIAGQFNVTEDTVKHHLTRIYDKVGVANRLELAMIATQKGLVANP
jgi:DNA-binding NarL/FixJ family response regulator